MQDEAAAREAAAAEVEAARLAKLREEYVASIPDEVQQRVQAALAKEVVSAVAIKGGKGLGVLTKICKGMWWPMVFNCDLKYDAFVHLSAGVATGPHAGAVRLAAAVADGKDNRA